MSFSLKNAEFHKDERGVLTSFNKIDLAEVRRMYQISPASTQTIRAWQGHQREQKWFQVIKGSFEVKLIEIDDWDEPSKDLEPTSIILDALRSQVLVIPKGYANGFRSLMPDSKLLVFSNFTLEDTRGDDFRFDKDYWFKWT